MGAPTNQVQLSSWRVTSLSWSSINTDRFRGDPRAESKSNRSDPLGCGLVNRGRGKPSDACDCTLKDQNSTVLVLWPTSSISDQSARLGQSDTGGKLGVLLWIRDGLRENPLRTVEGHHSLSFCKADVELLGESRAILSIPNLAVFLNECEACDACDIRGEGPAVTSLADLA